MTRQVQVPRCPDLPDLPCQPDRERLRVDLELPQRDGLAPPIDLGLVVDSNLPQIDGRLVGLVAQSGDLARADKGRGPPGRPGGAGPIQPAGEAGNLVPLRQRPGRREAWAQVGASSLIRASTKMSSPRRQRRSSTLRLASVLFSPAVAALSSFLPGSSLTSDQLKVVCFSPSGSPPTRRSVTLPLPFETIGPSAKLRSAFSVSASVPVYSDSPSMPHAPPVDRRRRDRRAGASRRRRRFCPGPQATRSRSGRMPRRRRPTPL